MIRTARTVALAAALASLAASARADAPTLSGTWTASPLSEKWSITDWGDACGPKPRPSGAPGGQVQITDRGGELSIIGAGRAFSTGECWEQMPGVSRTSHSASGRFWRNKCSSAANDPRRTTIVTTITASDSAISLNEQGTYEFIIQGTTCNASVARSRSFSLVRREGDEAPAASASAAPTAAPSTAPSAKAPPAKPEPKASRCNGSPGDPARLEVTPSRKLMVAGTKFAFKALVVDADGCAVGQRPSWSIAPGPLAGKATIDRDGELEVPADVEGKLEVTAKIGDKGVTIPVEVASPASYEAMLAASGLDANGEVSDAAVAVIATGTIGGKTATADDAAKQRKTLFVAIVATLAVGLGFAGLVLARRGKKRPDVGDVTEEEEEELVDLASPSPDALAPGPKKVRKKVRVAAPPRGKICPTCGERYGSEATFCGKDATKLVPLN